MNKLFSLLTLTLLLGLGLTQDADAQVKVGAHTGYNLDAPSEDGVAEGAFVLGGEARFRVGSLPVELNPSASYHLTGLENTSLWQFDANVLYPFGTANAVFTPYAGLGLGVTRISSETNLPVLGEVSRDETDYGLNLIGGATFGSGAIQPFAQAKVTFGNHAAYPNDDGEGGAGYALTGGVLFRLGR